MIFKKQKPEEERAEEINRSTEINNDYSNEDEAYKKGYNAAYKDFMEISNKANKTLTKNHMILHISLLIINFVLTIVMLGLFFGVSSHIKTAMNFNELEMLLGSSEGFFIFLHTLFAISYKKMTNKKK